jgi:diaminopimelate decarboxylase
MVGPAYVRGDFLATDRPLPSLERGALIEIFFVGAYGMVMASNYDNRPRVAEILVDGSCARLVCRRETYEDLVRPEVDLKQELDASRSRNLGFGNFDQKISDQ